MGIGRAVDEVIGEIGARSAVFLMSSKDRFSSWNVNPPILRTMLAISWFTASDSGCPPTTPGATLGALLHAQEAVGVQLSAAAPRSPSACNASPMTRRIPAKVGSSQLIEG